MKLFTINSTGKRGYWVGDVYRPSALGGCVKDGVKYTITSMPEYELHLSAKASFQEEEGPFEPEMETGDDALAFCMGKRTIGDQEDWWWVALVSEAGLKRGLAEGWIEASPLTPA